MPRSSCPGVENAPNDEEEAQREIDEDAKAQEMHEAIQAIINDPSKASMSAEQIAAFYEEMDHRNPSTKKEKPATKKRPEIIEDEDAPVPPAQIAATYEAADESVKNASKEPEIIEDEDAPVPAAQLAATYETTDEVSTKRKLFDTLRGDTTAAANQRSPGEVGGKRTYDKCISVIFA